MPLMLTLAEELGLSGSNLSMRVRKAFFQIPDDQMRELLQQIRDEAMRRHLVYLRDGKQDVISVFPSPLVTLRDQLTYIHYVSQTIHNTLKRLPDLYRNDPEIREILCVTPEEEEWLQECWALPPRDSDPVFGRLDALIDFTSPTWKTSLRCIEPNMSGIGGLHLVPTAERLVFEFALPLLTAQDPALRFELAPDIRELLMQDVRDHLDAIGRKGRNLCFVEPKYVGSGTDEQEELARYFHDKHGMKLMHADPAELELRNGEVCYGGDVVDLAYRDYTVNDLLDLQRTGVDVQPMRELFRQNRMMSSITAELDQKSCWEVLTTPRFTEKYFHVDERQIFRRHILWTRLVRDVKTQLPDGHSVELLEYARREREELVLKPNRAYGGQGVLIGPSLTQSEWETAIETALADPNRWVIQQLANIPISEFPVVSPDGKLHSEPFHVVMGFAPTQHGVAILGRASQKQVVNVAQRGGMCVVLVGQPTGGLHGPS